jgi:hypothetical protein
VTTYTVKGLCVLDQSNFKVHLDDQHLMVQGILQENIDICLVAVLICPLYGMFPKSHL